MRIVLVIALLLSLGVPSAYAAQRRGVEKKFQLVRKIYVGDMGSVDEAERFRFLLEEQLSKKGFTVVERAEDADAILSGALSVRVFDDKSEARVYVKLESPGGERLWARDFGNRLLRNPFNRKEPAKLRAEDVANGLRSDWKKASQDR